MSIDKFSSEEVLELAKLQSKYSELCKMGLQLDMSRGRPCTAQLDLSNSILDDNAADYYNDFYDYRNYSLSDGIDEAKELFAEILCVPVENIIVGGNSSLSLMFEVLSQAMSVGFGCGAWAAQQKIKFLCPAPGYDRHFAITEYFGIEMITVPITNEGPDMDIIKEHIKDPSVKGIWCVPKYSNPEGITYSDNTIRTLAAIKPVAKDFLIMYDNAYAVHHVLREDKLLNIFEECKRHNNEDMLIIFTSTSKITFPGAGISALATSGNTLAQIRRRLNIQTISYDKINQLRHYNFLKYKTSIDEHMRKHADILKPKFDIVLRGLENALGSLDNVRWTIPNGGYFISFYAEKGCAARIVELCKEAGVLLTPSGKTYPYGIDPDDSNIRIAPSLPIESELETAMDLFCTAVLIASLEKRLGLLK